MSLELLRKLNSMGLMKQLSPAIGVDFGVSSLKVIQVLPGPVPALVAAALVETPAEMAEDHAKRLEFQLQQLAKTIKKGGFRGKRVICSLPSWQLFCKHLQIQRVDGVPMGQLLGAAVGQQLGCDPSSLVLRHHEVPGGGGKAEVIVNAAARSAVEHMIQNMRKSGLEPVGMHSEFSAAMRAFEIAGSGENDSPTLYLDFGSHTTKAMIAHGKTIVFERVIEVGGVHLDKAIARQLKCPLASARATRFALENLVPENSQGEGMALLQGAPPSERGMDSPVDLREPLEILGDEIRMSLRYHDGLFPGRRVEHAVFLGGESRQQAFSRAVARGIGISTKLADPLARIARTGSEPCMGVDLKQPQPGFGVAVGLCHCPADL
ncbi:MAG: hypothetical protein JSR52_12980 [Planctomycetes bacterium]|nr:hypothetical protein [Planctomycetota bacterium]